MDIHEIAEKSRDKNYPKDDKFYEDIVDFCINEINIDLNDSDTTFLCTFTAKVILKMRAGKINEKEAKFLAKYFAKVSARNFLIDDNIDVEFPDEKEYKERYGDVTGGICTSNLDNNFKIVYSPTTIKQLTSSDPSTFLRGLRTVFHEVGHAKQNMAIQNDNIQGIKLGLNKVFYIMALESLARNVEPGFYKEHYDHLFKETNAEKIGLKEAMEYLNVFAPNIYKLYNQEWVQAKIEEYDKDFYNAKCEVNGNEIELFKKIETFASAYIEKYPDVIKKYPILSIGYHKDGTKKDIMELIEDRKKALEECKTEEDKNKIDEFYELIANHRNAAQIAPDELKNELIKVSDYITKTGTDDEFVFGIFKHRVSKSTLPEEKKQNTIDNMYRAAKLVREKKKREENDGNKDEEVDERD